MKLMLCGKIRCLYNAIWGLCDVGIMRCGDNAMSEKSKVAQNVIPSNFAIKGNLDPMHPLGARAYFQACVHDRA